MLKKKKNNLNGFSLLELAIVLAILAILFSGVLVSHNERVFQQQEKQNAALFEQIKKQLLGFFIAHKRLPCPSSASSNGEPAFSSGSNSVCFSQYGFLPFKALELQGVVSPDNLFLDEWKRPIRYNITDKDYNANDHWDWVYSPDIVQTTTLSKLVGNLKICDTIDCLNVVYAKEAVVIIHSQGKLDKQTSLEQENSGEASVVVNGKSIGISNDNTFVYLPQRNLTEANYFDDFLLWVAPVEFYYYLVD
jgi:prepilin-type N-terminal cleavage/methylation domain-containing protein